MCVRVILARALFVPFSFEERGAECVGVLYIGR